MSEPSYIEAARELEGILNELEGQGLDVDAVATKVERAEELITLCRGRVKGAQARVARLSASE